MRKLLLLGLIMATFYGSASGISSIIETQKSSFQVENEDFAGQVIFPAGYSIGDYIEFAGASPYDAGSSGNYEISISYTRGNIASAATYLASVSHANPTLWREVGRVNSNGYISGSISHNFTVDCNTEYGNPRFRVRAINTSGVLTHPIPVNIRIRSINFNSGWRTLSSTGNDLTVTKFLPMTNDWSLYVGNTFTPNGAVIAIKAIENGNVGIGTDKPDSKLAVNGNIRAHEIKVETANWPDYVFDDDYSLSSLEELERYITLNKHLPEIPSAVSAEKEGVDLGNMNRLLLKKIEELTLHLISKDKEIKELKKLNQKVGDLEIKMNQILGLNKK